MSPGTPLRSTSVEEERSSPLILSHQTMQNPIFFMTTRRKGLVISSLRMIVEIKPFVEQALNCLLQISPL